jgi:hypothetical protein
MLCYQQRRLNGAFVFAAEAQAIRRGGFAAGEEALNECRRASLLHPRLTLLKYCG